MISQPLNPLRRAVSSVEELHGLTALEIAGAISRGMGIDLVSQSLETP